MNHLIPAPHGVNADNGTILISDDQDIWRLSGMADDNDVVFLFFAGDAFHVGEAKVESGPADEPNRLVVALLRGSVVTHMRSSTDEDVMELIDAMFRLGPLGAFPGTVDVLIGGEPVSADVLA